MLGLSIMFPANPREYVWLQIQFFYPSRSLNFRRASEINKKIWLLADAGRVVPVDLRHVANKNQMSAFPANGNRPSSKWESITSLRVEEKENMKYKYRCRSIEKQADVLLAYTHNMIYHCIIRE